jgi:hypothetical protein
MLREEIQEALDLFDEFKIPEEDQRRLFEEGLHFDFTYGDPDYSHRNQQLNVFGVAILLKTCRENHIRINTKKLLREPYMFEDEDLIKDVAKEQERTHRRVKSLGRKKN